MTPKEKKLINELLDKEIESYGNYWEEKNLNEWIETKKSFNKIKTKKK